LPVGVLCSYHRTPMTDSKRSNNGGEALKQSNFIDLPPERQERLLEILMPAVLHALLTAGKLEEERLTDLQYLLEVLEEHNDVVEDVINNTPVRFRIDETFLAEADDAIQKNRPLVAVVLIATAVEHQLNLFLRDVMEWLSDVSESEIRDALRSTSVWAKIGWLFHVLAECQMPTPLRSSILRLSNLRNAIVHHKFPHYVFGDMGARPYLVKDLKNQIDDIGLEKIRQLPTELEEFLEMTRRSKWPSYEAIQEATKRLFKKPGKSPKSP